MSVRGRANPAKGSTETYENLPPAYRVKNLPQKCFLAEPYESPDAEGW